MGVCVCEEGKGGVTYVVPEFTSDYMAKFTRSTKEKKREEGKEEEEEREKVRVSVHTSVHAAPV